MSALILAYYSTIINLYSPIIRYNNDSKDLQKAAEINVALRYVMCHTKRINLSYLLFILFILSYSILDWFDSFTCQS